MSLCHERRIALLVSHAAAIKNNAGHAWFVSREFGYSLESVHDLLALDNLQKKGSTLQEKQRSIKAGAADKNVRAHLAEYGVFAIEVRRGYCSNKKLASVRVGAGVSHGQQVFDIVRKCKTALLVSKLLTIDALATGTVTIGEVSALAHEIRNDPMKARAFVRQRFFGVALAHAASAIADA